MEAPETFGGNARLPKERQPLVTEGTESSVNMDTRRSPMVSFRLENAASEALSSREKAARRTARKRGDPKQCRSGVGKWRD